MIVGIYNMAYFKSVFEKKHLFASDAKFTVCYRICLDKYLKHYVIFRYLKIKHEHPSGKSRQYSIYDKLTN